MSDSPSPAHGPPTQKRHSSNPASPLTGDPADVDRTARNPVSGAATATVPASRAAHRPSSRQGQAHDHLAVVIPVYRGYPFLRELCTRLITALSTITDEFSIVLVDDRGSPQDWPLIKALASEDSRIRGVQLSRNFGQHTAITAGIDHARADWYVVMDGDLQDAPEDIPSLYRMTRADRFDIVVAGRQKEGHGLLKRWSSKLFYMAFNRVAGIELDWSVGNFRIFSDRVAEGFRRMREQMRFLPANLNFMGFEVGRLELPHYRRTEGRSSYTFLKLARLGLNTILAHSQMPLKAAAALGLATALLAFAAAISIAVLALVHGTPVTGWASLIVAVFFVGGMQMLVTGIVGIYVGKNFEESKERPLYFVRDSINLPADHTS